MTDQGYIFTPFSGFNIENNVKRNSRQPNFFCLGKQSKSVEACSFPSFSVNWIHLVVVVVVVVVVVLYFWNQFK